MVILFVSVVLLAGVAMLAYGLWSARQADVSQGWDVVKGTLISHAIVEIRGRYGARSYMLTARYSYDAGGARHESRRVSFGTQFFDTYDEVRLWLEENVKDGRIDVFHDPKRPAASVLLPGRAGAQGFFLWMAAGGLVSFFGAVLLYAQLR